ncbi:type II toxin-antitoxin system Phd/YefM family antitoxin [Rhodococcus sp. IEGM 1408]|uniref:type II toxin-antitoxin system Phd/YefM family antitoxin n=1 Tax=Rhodococcus sp. IEGM 1408 TaxID=3082220 RepID=UPI00398A247F
MLSFHTFHARQAAKLNALLAEVESTGSPVTITSHGRPVAILTPATPPRRITGPRILVRAHMTRQVLLDTNALPGACREARRWSPRGPRPSPVCEPSRWRSNPRTRCSPAAWTGHTGIRSTG